MFRFFKSKNIVDAGLLNGFVDIHSHLLWGVDDGMQTMEETLEALCFYETLGVQRIVLTPHVMEDMPLNHIILLHKRFVELQQIYAGNIELRLGAEYMLDAGFQEHVNCGDLLTVCDNTVLIETSYLSAPLGFDCMLDCVQKLGFQVILAHPERYGYMGIKEYEQLKSRNVKLQLNILSLCGIYNKNSQAKAEKLLGYGWYDFIGTDMHNLNFYTNKLGYLKLQAKELNNLEKLISQNNTILLH